jgi:LTXXQ motif family protein
MQTRTLASTILLAFAPFLTHAQTATTHTPPTPTQAAANKVTRLTKLLDLSTSQQTEATGYFTTEETTLATVRTALHTAHTALEADIKTANSADIVVQAKAIGTLTTEEVQARATADAAFYAILSGDQQTKYEAIGPRGGFGGGPGGPGGPGPHGTH